MKKISFLLLLFCLPTLVEARILIEVTGGSSRKLPMAVVPLTTIDGGSNSYTKKITQLLITDLKIAGYFKVLNQKSFLDKKSSASDIDFKKWAAIDAFGVIKGIVESRPQGRILVELRLYDVASQKLLTGKQYELKKKSYPKAVHRFMDEMLRSLTGRRGPFSSLIVAACGKNNQRQIHSFAIDGTQHSVLTKNKVNNISPQFSPRGRSIVFTSFLEYYPEIFIMNARGGSPRQLTYNRVTSITPAFAPNGKTIAFASSRSEDFELFLMNRSGRVLKRLTRVLNIDVSPAWSPDGSRLVFASERAGNLHLFMTNIHSGGTARLTYTGYQNDQPDFSPNGQKIVFTSRDQGTFDIFVMNSDGSMIRRITRDEGSNESPTFSPDSRYIAFSSQRRRASGVYVMMEDGNNQTLIPGTASCINPDWGPRLK